MDRLHAGRRRTVPTLPCGACPGGEGRPVSFLANGGNNTVSWSPDGSFLIFDTGQRTESGQLARVDLMPRTPKLREDHFRDLFKEETPKTLNPALKQPPLSAEPQTTPTQGATSTRASEAKEKPAPKPVQI